MLSRFLLNVCGLHFDDPRSHMGIPYADSTISASSFEASDIRFNASRILSNLGATLSDPALPEDSLEPESHLAHLSDLDVQVERDGLPGITDSTFLDPGERGITGDTVVLCST